MGKMEKRKIVEVLRAMGIGDEERFPLEQFNSVRNTAQGVNLLRERKELGMKWSVRLDSDELLTIVRRVE